ncbi:Xylulokinase (Xylulose kinase) [Bosea sp. LC85]|uniref:xylulokinase n=1 Tax=Bosea sp. LC85 TaxID=1502851 RepID=UPI0004E3C354|nr:xylulokinase [Bosea sp. LC85]KFC76032.1 Xylulokinase (Xylulose kinase) [Bosea sp. LC85]
MSFIGIDLGTSSLKAILVDDRQHVVAATTRDLTVFRYAPLWSEQEPGDWIAAALAALRDLRNSAPSAFRLCRGIGLSGQMHGAVLLDEADRPLRPCILWNDGRASAECAELEVAEPAACAITGNLAMPGFTAPKLLWLRRHEPDLFRRTRKILLPKAYLRLVLTGEAIEEMSDASGTLWLDVGSRDWSDRMIAATGLERSQMPALVEGSEPAGRMRPDLARELGFETPPLFAGGAGDNAAGAVGLGAVAAGASFLSLGTSGVLWRTTAGFEPRAEKAVHAFCHALPGRWHQMSVHLSAAASLNWWATVTGNSEAELLAALGETAQAPSPVLFTPYLSGERTPQNDPQMRGGFARLGFETGRNAMTQAVLEGVAFAFRDGKAALESAGAPITEAVVIGGGARSDLWLSTLASVLDMPLHRYPQTETGAAFGAARLARLACTGEDPIEICTQPGGSPETFLPQRDLVAAYMERYDDWRSAAEFSRALH